MPRESVRNDVGMSPGKAESCDIEVRQRGAGSLLSRWNSSPGVGQKFALIVVRRCIAAIGNGGAFWRSGLVDERGASLRGAGATCTGIRRVAPARSGSQRAHCGSRHALIAEAAKDLADYQRLTAEGKLGEAGQKLEELKRAIDKLNTRQR